MSTYVAALDYHVVNTRFIFRTLIIACYGHINAAHGDLNQIRMLLGSSFDVSDPGASLIAAYNRREFVYPSVNREVLQCIIAFLQTCGDYLNAHFAIFLYNFIGFVSVDRDSGNFPMIESDPAGYFSSISESKIHELRALNVGMDDAMQKVEQHRESAKCEYVINDE
jgi:hypothetical protein